MNDTEFELILAETKRKFEESFAEVFSQGEEQDFFKLDGVENEG